MSTSRRRGGPEGRGHRGRDRGRDGARLRRRQPDRRAVLDGGDQRPARRAGASHSRYHAGRAEAWMDETLAAVARFWATWSWLLFVCALAVLVAVGLAWWRGRRAARAAETE